MRKIVTLIIGVVVVALGVYLFTAGGTEKDAVKAGETTDIKQLVQDINAGKIQVESASITSKTLTVTGGKEADTKYELPKDDFFVAIAPYMKQTHPCATHNLAGCQGELTSQDFDVRIEDAKGNVVVNETMKSGNNGFLDLWLPRNQTYSVTVKYNGKSAESEISTFEDSDTCVTTMKLA